jgi:hypothetical protein
MEPGLEAGMDRGAESRLERFVERHDVSVGECLVSRVRGNDGSGERRVRDEIHSASVTPNVVNVGPDSVSPGFPLSRE